MKMTQKKFSILNDFVEHYRRIIFYVPAQKPPSAAAIEHGNL